MAKVKKLGAELKRREGEIKAIKEANAKALKAKDK